MYTALELLSPAKDLQTGIAAIKHGADAVYIAAEKFGAREKAGNSLDDIKKLVVFAHQYFAKVYVTVNTILFDNELNAVKDLIVELYNAKVDAIIIQDFAILDMDIPPIPIHASTQMHNSTPEKLIFLENHNINRVVLPRELSLEEIKNFSNTTHMELEFFIHGALCVSYSGQCYMSQLLTGRSANRGACAQPCRSTYDLIDSDGKILVKNKHLLSLKDLNLSEYISQLIDAGITSFKIEGRLKDIGYVKNITAYYNTIINNIIRNKADFRRSSSGNCNYTFIPDPERSFNRGFTQHFIKGRTNGQASFHTQKSTGKFVGKIKQVTSTWFTVDTLEPIHNGDGLCYFDSAGELQGFLVNKSDQGKIFPNHFQNQLKTGVSIFRNADIEFEKLLKGESSSRQVEVSVTAKQQDGKFLFTATDEDGISITFSIEDNFAVAQNKGTALTNMANQLAKSGGTIFKIDNINIIGIETPKHIPISTLNSVRRNLLDDLLNARIDSHKIKPRIEPHVSSEYPISTVDYKGNVSNTKSKQFLINHGVKNIDNAFELEQPKENVELMVSRYCIKFELGICPSKQGAKNTKSLFLKDNKYIYPLVFDCKNCEMKVMMLKK